MSIDNKEYPLVCEDSELEVRRDTHEERGYVVVDKKREQFILFPRGTLEETAKSNRDAAKGILRNLASSFFFDETNLTYDSISAIVTKAWLKEYEEYVNSEEFAKYVKEFK
jgi:hypothetical protein